MIEKKRRCAAFAVCGSFCTLEAALDAARALRGQGWELLPVMSFAAGQDTRFGRASGWRHQLEGLTGRPVLDTLQAVEPLGPRHLADALVIAPCTGATLARLAEGLSDTPVTLAAKSLLRVGCPVVIAVSTNDGLGASGENIARLYQRKHYYLCLTGRMTLTPSPRASRHGSSCCPRRWKRRWKGGNYSRCCNVRVDERCLFRQGKVWYTKFIYEDLWRIDRMKNTSLHFLQRCSCSARRCLPGRWVRL